MKRKITLLLLAAGSMFSMKSQVIFSENFTSPFVPAAAGWSVQNLSAGTPTLAWFQGNGAGVFPAYNGSPDDYYGCNFNNTTATNDISSWLITPTMTIQNGLIFEFATRTGNSATATVYPDRLQVRMSEVGTTPIATINPIQNSVGTFTNLLLDINPNLSAANSSVVNNGTVNGYPFAWAVYTIQISGLSGPVTGKFAFRYFVQGGGPTGNNSNYIGVDAVKLKMPCDQPTLAIAQTTSGVCSGNTVGLLGTTIGSVTAATYTWSNGANSANTTVTPTATTIYTLSATSASGCTGTQTIAVTVTATPVMNLQSYTVCQNPATTVTLTATGAVTYSWSNGATTATTAVTPNTTTTYTVMGFGAGGSCPGVGTTTVTLSNQLSMAINASSTTICSGRTVTLTAISAATTYSWNTGAITPVITVTPGTTTTYSVGGYSGAFPNVCAGGNTILISVIPSPTLSVTISPSVICGGSTFVLNSSGATTYTYFITPTSGYTNNPATIPTNTTATGAVGSLTLVGTAANGCVAAGQITVQINPAPVLTVAASAPTVCVNKTVTITGSGADTYAWSGAATSASNPFTYTAGATAGAQVFSVTGTSSVGCTGTATLSVSVVVCTTPTSGLVQYDGSSEALVFPNPFNNELNLSGLEGRFELYNSLGQIVLQGNITGNDKLNTTDLPKGPYMLKAYDSNGEVNRIAKLVKN